MSIERNLDWRSYHDPASRRYPMRSVLRAAALPRTYALWPTGPVLDQGEEGACVGHGWTNEATSEPVPVDFEAIDLGTDDEGYPWPRDAQEFAFHLYFYCRRHDQWPGEDYSGTSVLAGAQAMQLLGLIPEYRWCFGIEDVIDTLVSPLGGPVVLGIVWKSGMYDAPNGELRATGHVVGGHCILAVGYDPEHEWEDGTTSEAVALFNSWGEGWGIGGLAWIRCDELAGLLDADGEACVPVQRAYGPVLETDDETAPEPLPNPYRGRAPAWRTRFREWLSRSLAGYERRQR